MAKFLIINDFNDINDAQIRHFSLDKGHFIARSLVKCGCKVYFMTIKKDYEKYGIQYISTDNITDIFIDGIDYILIPREPLLPTIIKVFPPIRKKLAMEKTIRDKPRFIIKSDSPIWFSKKTFINEICKIYPIAKSRPIIRNWIIEHVDYICAQNEDFAKLALKLGIPRKSLLISNMGVSPEIIDYRAIPNPYNINHEYCVDSAASLGYGKALWPAYYVNNPGEKSGFNKKKYIILYTGRIKTDQGKILFNMKNIMDLLGESFELHIFPGSFMIPTENGATSHSAKNIPSLDMLRNIIFKDNKNIIVHFPYMHEEKYKYLYHADCGIDFSDIRPKQGASLAGHAKILEYCENGLPVVCEKKIHNLCLIEQGKNGIVLPYMASDIEYAEAIKKIVKMDINREFCRKITVETENWDKKAAELLQQLGS